MDPLITNFRLLARYNSCANTRLYEACAQLDDTERKLVRQAYFKSIHGTLNHILVGDRIWLARFEGREVPSTGLDAILYDDFTELQAARIAEDQRIAEMTASLTEALLTRSITYVNNQGHTFTDPLDLLITHFFNHQTHHRGQVHALLSQTAIAPPALDLHRMLRP